MTTREMQGNTCVAALLDISSFELEWLDCILKSA